MCIRYLNDVANIVQKMIFLTIKWSNGRIFRINGLSVSDKQKNSASLKSGTLFFVYEEVKQQQNRNTVCNLVAENQPQYLDD